MAVRRKLVDTAAPEDAAVEEEFPGLANHEADSRRVIRPDLP